MVHDFCINMYNRHKMDKKYDHQKVEKKWQDKWEKDGLFTPNIESSLKKDNFYNLWMFPYPSAEGLHAGHAFASTGSDIYGKYMRMTGKTVFQPIGYDSFGIHSENFAIKIGEHPSKMLERTTATYERQMRSLGHSYDWTRTVTTSNPDYYKWTQWLFLEMFKSGLAYRKEAKVNWCPSCRTVLADEQVMTPKQAGKDPKSIDGKAIIDFENVMVCERCGFVVEKKMLAQWFFRITDYADRLLDNLKTIDWTNSVKVAQHNWIGKKAGINIEYKLSNENRELKGESIICFTTRPDTNYGATFVVVSPEYAEANIVRLLENETKNTVLKYIKKSLSRTEQQRLEEGKKKTGVFTGLYAINNLNNYKMPVYVADFVLSGFGTGAVVGVPGHDKRDFEFAKEFALPIVRVVIGENGDTSEIKTISQVQESSGIMINSEFLNDLDIHEATQKIMDYLEAKGWGKRVFNYHLRDWLISRQRYWGPPIPMIYCEKCASNGKGYLSQAGNLIHNDQSDWNLAGWYPEDKLPVSLPDLADYMPKGSGRGPLDDHPEFYEVNCPHCGQKAKRETDVSDTFVDSAWYFLRYPSVGAKSDEDKPFDPEIIKKWMPVDLYFGGAEHSVLHLMYARFATMVLKDRGHLGFEEPFPRFFAHGLMIKDGAKMSKSRGNVVNPDEYVEKFGADTLRMYLMFMGPMDGYPDFRDTGIEGMRRFTERIWKLFEVEGVSLTEDENRVLEAKMHTTIKKVTSDIESFKYNTAIAAIMEFVNALVDHSHNKNEQKASKRNIFDECQMILAQLLAPFAPHLMEELWMGVLGQNESIHTSSWPKYDEDLATSSTLTIVVQINGKIRGQIQIPSSDIENKDKIISLAKSDNNVQKWLGGNAIKKEVYVSGRLVSFVV